MKKIDLETAFFEAWLAKKFIEVIKKIGKERLSSEEMLILVFKYHNDKLKSTLNILEHRLEIVESKLHL